MERDTIQAAQKPEALDVILKFAAMSPRERRDVMMFMYGAQAAQSVESVQPVRSGT